MILAAALRDAGVRLDAGLSDTEVEAAEKHSGIRFPPDLRGLLQAALPVGEGWPTWRNLDTLPVDLSADPTEGVLFDVENNDFWWPGWGPEPAGDGDGDANNERSAHIAQARAWIYAHAPKLVPVFAHRCMASTPHVAGQPVLSIHQSDIIVYGRNLAAYLSAEFGPFAALDDAPSPNEPAVRIDFWQDLADLADLGDGLPADVPADVADQL